VLDDDDDIDEDDDIDGNNDDNGSEDCDICGGSGAGDSGGRDGGDES
jgi:hypothetical protein